jgi:hypothetical protein
MSEFGFATRLSFFQRALLGEVPCSLRGLTVGWGNSDLEIHCVFDGEIEDDDREAMEVVASEVVADFPETNHVEVECIRKDFPEDIKQSKLKMWIYLRKEKTD